MPQNSNFRLPRGHRFFPQNGSYGYGAKSRWGRSRVHLGSNGVPLGKKNGSKPSKITMPQNSNFRLPRGHRFFPKLEVTVMAPNHGGYPLGSILGPVGSLWVKKMGQNRRKLTCPKIRIFPKNGSYGYGAKSRRGHHRVHLGASGVPLGKKHGSKPSKITMPQNSNFRLPRGHLFLQKMEVTVMAPNHGGDTIESILGLMGSHWVHKMGQNRKKLPCPKIRIFDCPAVIVFSEKMEFTVMVPNHGGDALGSILGPMGSHWVQKMCQNRKKLPCPKIRIFYYLAVIDFL